MSNQFEIHTDMTFHEVHFCIYKEKEKKTLVKIKT